MKAWKNSLVVASCLLSLSALAEDVKIKGLELKDLKGIGQLSVKLTGNLEGNPDLKVNGKTIELVIPNAHTNKMTKKVGNVILTSSQLDRSTVKIVANFPASLAGKEGLVNVTLKDGSIDLSFPSVKGQAVKTTSPNVARAPGIVANNQADIKNEALNKEAEKLDENYLQNLEKEHAKLAEAKHADETKKEATVNNQLNDNSDRVKMTQSSVAKGAAGSEKESTESPKSTFSLAGYIGKFVAFLSIMLLGFYGVLTLFKKGVIKKGKLGFLNSTKLVEVLSTTHVAPKRTLMMVKAHKQVFLVASSETGMTLISEINDVAGLIKNGEEEITGSNFDTNLRSANNSNKEFKLKEPAQDYVDYDSLDEMLNEAPISSNENATSAARAIEKTPVRDSVRFSDQIKTKVKGLKQLP